MPKLIPIAYKQDKMIYSVKSSTEIEHAQKWYLPSV